MKRVVQTTRVTRTQVTRAIVAQVSMVTARQITPSVTREECRSAWGDLGRSLCEWAAVNHDRVRRCARLAVLRNFWFVSCVVLVSIGEGRIIDRTTAVADVRSQLSTCLAWFSFAISNFDVSRLADGHTCTSNCAAFCCTASNSMHPQTRETHAHPLLQVHRTNPKCRGVVGGGEGTS